MNIQHRTVCLAGVLTAAALLCSPAASWSSSDAERTEAVVVTLKRGIVDGYREADAGKIISIYANDARIATTIFGALSKDGFLDLLDNDLRANRAIEATLNILEVTFPEDEARVVMELSLSRENDAGEKRVTRDKLFLRMKFDKDWQIAVQTYKSDFSLPERTPSAHGH